jgi:hypothetical protein
MIDSSFCLDTTRQSSSSGIKRLHSIRINLPDDYEEDNSSQSTFASSDGDNHWMASEIDDWFTQSDDDFDINESSSSSSSIYDISDLLTKDTMRIHDIDQLDKTTTSECYSKHDFDKSDKDIEILNEWYSNIDNINIDDDDQLCSSSDDDDQQFSSCHRRVSFDCCTYVREYNLTISEHSDARTIDSKNNSNHKNNKCLIQLSWEHTPIMIRTLQKRSPKKKYTPPRRLTIAERKNRLALLHNIAIHEVDQLLNENIYGNPMLNRQMKDLYQQLDTMIYEYKNDADDFDPNKCKTNKHIVDNNYEEAHTSKENNRFKFLDKQKEEYMDFYWRNKQQQLDASSDHDDTNTSETSSTSPQSSPSLSFPKALKKNPSLNDDNIANFHNARKPVQKAASFCVDGTTSEQGVRVSATAA